VLAERVTSPLDIPPWDNSSMDGYAVRGEDLQAAGTTLTIVETIPAGAFPAKPLSPGDCARVFTGAAVPEGADCVIRQEHTTPLDEATIRIDDLTDLGRNIRARGEDIERDTVVFEPGTEIGPAQIGVLASLAHAEVAVHRIPRVAILASGDEIADLDERGAILSGRKIASSNTYTMMAMAGDAGAEPANLGIALDDPLNLRQRLEGAVSADIIVTSGAMSVGEHDHLRSMLQQAGADMKFWRLKTRPGAPVGFGLLNGKPWLGLPGNPVSTMVSFELFVRPAIRRLRGHRALFRRTRVVRIGERISTPPRLTHFLRVCVVEEDGTRVVRLTGAQGSGILTSMAKADALLIVPEEVDELEVGATATAILLNEPEHTETMPY
jgi:molybdopterin molybdotransferase